MSETEFDEIFARIRERRLPYWADPGQRERDQINSWADGRGVYFEDPNGHLLEIITRPYGSGGTSASRPHPLVVRKLEPENHPHGARAEEKPTAGRGIDAPRKPAGS